jgi:hypothetical protein
MFIEILFLITEKWNGEELNKLVYPYHRVLLSKKKKKGNIATYNLDKHYSNFAK